ncbi:hypothetical protein V496_10316, partial [Pseudogymnoascus sp. VKM F-4515 (FW-2607)]
YASRHRASVVRASPTHPKAASLARHSRTGRISTYEMVAPWPKHTLSLGI